MLVIPKRRPVRNNHIKMATCIFNHLLKRIQRLVRLLRQRARPYQTKPFRHGLKLLHQTRIRRKLIKRYYLFNLRIQSHIAKLQVKVNQKRFAAQPRRTNSAQKSNRALSHATVRPNNRKVERARYI